MIEHIAIQSAGTFTVAVIALMMTGIQLIFAFRKPSFPWYLWGAALTFAGMLYAAGVFLEYYRQPGPVNRFGGVLEFTAHVLLIHGLYGLTFSYLNLEGKLYHRVAGAFHILCWGFCGSPLSSCPSGSSAAISSAWPDHLLKALGRWALVMLYIAARPWRESFVASQQERRRAAQDRYLPGWFLAGAGITTRSRSGLPTIQYLMDTVF